MNNIEKNKLTKLELIYNTILFAITLIAIILFMKPILSIIKYTIEMIMGTLDPKTVSLGGLVELSMLGAFIIPIMIGIIVVSIITYIVLIIVLFRVRKVKKRKSKWIDFILLIVLGIVLGASLGFYNKESIQEYICNISIVLVNIEILLLIIVLLTRKRRLSN